VYKRRLLFITLCAFAVAVVLAFGWRTQRYGPISGHTIIGANVPAIVRSLRPNYPYSVIAGGAYSRAELRFSNEHDMVVRDHYADFDLDGARVVTLSADRYVFASYRIKNHIYWTKRRLRIRKGEALLTDGKNYARARCGNRLSSQPQSPTLELQPPEAALNLPPFTPDRLYMLQLADGPPPGALQQQFSPEPDDIPTPAGLPRTTEPVLQSLNGWPALNQYFPAAFAPGILYPTQNQPSSTTLPPPDNIPPVISNTPPPVSPIPEPATISLAICAALACLLLTRVVLLRRTERNRKA
jgi:hypothetical protein